MSNPIMEYSVYLAPHFKKQIRHLARRIPDIASVLTDTLNKCDLNSCIPLGHCLYKLRIPLRSNSIGKSGGLRLIILILRVKGVIAPIRVYKKSITENIRRDKLLTDARIIAREMEYYL